MRRTERPRVPAFIPDLTPAKAQTASASIRFGDRFHASADLSITPAGLLAIGGLVAAVLLSIPPIIRAAADAHRAARD